jgi:hypothetical protein
MELVVLKTITALLNTVTKLLVYANHLANTTKTPETHPMGVIAKQIVNAHRTTVIGKQENARLDTQRIRSTDSIAIRIGTVDMVAMDFKLSITQEALLTTSQQPKH